MNPGEALMILIVPTIRPICDRRLRFTFHNLRFRTSHHTIPDGVELENVGEDHRNSILFVSVRML